GGSRHPPRGHRVPAGLAQQALGAIDRQLEAMGRPPWQVNELDELFILVTIDIREPFVFPLHHWRETLALGRRMPVPQLGDHGLPGLVPREAASGRGARRRADVGAEREEMIEALEE